MVTYVEHRRWESFDSDETREGEAEGGARVG